MAAGQAYPTTQVNEPGSSLLPGESFSPFLLLVDDALPAAPDVLSLTVPPAVTTLVAPGGAPAPSSGIDWVIVLIVAGVLLIAMGGNGQ